MLANFCRFFVFLILTACGEGKIGNLKVGKISIPTVPTISGVGFSAGGSCGVGITSSIVPDKWGIPGRFANFEDACREHDACYDHQRGKDFCDDEFKKNLVKSCKKAFNGFVFKIQKAECTHVVANLYLAFVKSIDAYDKCADEACL